MESLRALTESLAQIRGRRKVMLYFTHGLGMDVFDTLDHAGGTRSIAFDDFHAAMSAATRGNIAIYPIDPAGLTLQGSLNEAIDLRALAYATGGEAIVNTNSIASGLARIVRENSTYYVLGFASTNDRREGQFRKVQVQVSRPGLVVRTRTGYLEPQRHAPKQAVTTIATLPSGLAKALEQPLANRAVPMTVFAAPYRSGDRQATIVIAQEMETAALGLTPGRRLAGRRYRNGRRRGEVRRQDLRRQTSVERRDRATRWCSWRDSPSRVADTGAARPVSAARGRRDGESSWQCDVRR